MDGMGSGGEMSSKRRREAIYEMLFMVCPIPTEKRFVIKTVQLCAKRRRKERLS